MRPSRKLITLLLYWLCLSFFPALARYFLPVGMADVVIAAWWSMGGMIALALVVDLVLSRSVRQLIVKRQLPGNLSVGVG